MLTRLLLIAAVGTLASSSPGRRHAVEMSQFRFKPAVIRVAAGDTIVWVNQDIVPHTARADKGAFDTGDIPAKSAKRIVIRTKGEHEFTCLYHSNMKGKLVVR